MPSRRGEANAGPWTASALAEAVHLAWAAQTLDSLDVLQRLDPPQDAQSLAQRLGVDAELLAGALEILARRTDLVTCVEGRYLRGPGYDAQARFLLNLYVGAFGPVTSRLAESLRDPGSAGRRLDADARARAFDGAPTDAASTLAGILHQLGLGRVLDLGCGSGLLLTALASHDPAFRGVGVDVSAAACRSARRRLRQAGASRRVRIIEADARDPDGWPLDAGVTIETIVAGDLLNEMMSDEGREAVAWLRRLRATLPERTLVVADYYGALGKPGRPGDPRTLLHDFVQLASGQGVPPPDCGGWAALYERAGCRLVHALEDPHTSRFVHIVKL
ncbi:MAG TPA: class I SAM-dependent methyltransferase [Caulobacteraceae bacterium]|nr:class I SAM-dependent methyltransferase [Caulobacteraceae bacterium]